MFQEAHIVSHKVRRNFSTTIQKLLLLMKRILSHLLLPIKFPCLFRFSNEIKPSVLNSQPCSYLRWLCRSLLWLGCFIYFLFRNEMGYFSSLLNWLYFTLFSRLMYWMSTIFLSRNGVHFHRKWYAFMSFIELSLINFSENLNKTFLSMDNKVSSIECSVTLAKDFFQKNLNKHRNEGNFSKTYLTLSI